MLPLLLGMIVFFFLFIGAVVYVLCILIPTLRKYTLSAALWCASFGFSSVAFLLFAGVAVVASSFLPKSGDLPSLQASKLEQALGVGYLILGTLASTVFATVIAWFHQVIVKRLTFALFRLYATFVSAGIGSVFGWSLGWYALSIGLPNPWLWWIPSMLLLIAAFGAAAYRGAAGLRGQAPTRFTWISPEEYAGR